MTHPKAKFLYPGSVQLDNEPVGIGFIKFQAVDIDTDRDKLFIPGLYGRWSVHVELTAEAADLAIRSLNARRRVCEGEGITIVVRFYEGPCRPLGDHWLGHNPW